MKWRLRIFQAAFVMLAVLIIPEPSCAAGIIAPTEKMKFDYFIGDNKSDIIMAVGLLILLVYYIIAWVIAGRDPKKRTIVPLYDPPGNISPAVMRYIVKMAFDTKAVVAAIADMTAKGFLSMHEENGIYVLTRKQDSDSDLSEEERIIFKNLFDSQPANQNREQNLVLNGSSSRKVIEAMEEARRAVVKSTGRKYFGTGIWLSSIGIIWSLAVMIAVCAFEIMYIPIVLIRILIAFALFIAIYIVFDSLKAIILNKFLSTIRFKVGYLINLIMLSLMLVVMGAVVYQIWQASNTPVYDSLFIAFLAVNVIFAFLLRARTTEGRKLLDDIEGFRMFLEATEKEKVNWVNPVGETLVFDKYLPYAIALDVEIRWADWFSEVLFNEDDGRRCFKSPWQRARDEDNSADTKVEL